MLDMTTLRKLHQQLNQDAIIRAMEMYALFENMEFAEVLYAAKSVVGNRTKTGRLAYREVTVSVRWLEPRSFLIWDYPREALKKIRGQEVAA